MANTRLCSGCGAENRSERRFCLECGAALPLSCARCGSVNEAGARFCGDCGAPLQSAAAGAGIAPAATSCTPGKPAHDARAATAVPADAERRPITVLFADLAGYTRLSQDLDPEDVHRLLGQYFEAVDGIVSRWGGTIDKHIGDAVMALFGAPVAHGNDALRAVRAAAEIQAAMPALGSKVGHELGVHVGITTGEVMASGLGSSQHHAYTVVGQSVNLAARLLGVAQAGETIVDETVYDQTRHVVRFAPVEGVQAKGIDLPFRAWQLIEIRHEPDEDDTPLAGRETELAQLVAVLDSCKATGSGITVCLRGEAGIGKSRLLRELRRRAIERAFACHNGLVLDFGTAKGRDAVREIVLQLLRLSPDADLPVRMAALEACGTHAPEHRPFLYDLLDLPQPVDMHGLYEAMDSATRQNGRAAAIVALLRHASTKQPLLVCVEDVHWADPATLGYVSALAHAAAGMPMILALTSRLEGDQLDAAWRATLHGKPLVTIDLGPLAAHQALALASALLSTSEAMAQRCVERAAGNPLFLEQLLRAANEHDERLPASLHSLVLARIDRLPERDRMAARVAAVVGQRFGLAPLRHVARLADYRCDALVAHFLVRPDGDDYLFAHALIRDGIYASLTRARRAELHRAAADWFEQRDPALRAEHLDRAESPDAPRAYLVAARAQIDTLHLESALALAERGGVLARDPADVHALGLVRGEMLRELGDGRRAVDAYGQAFDAARDGPERCRALIGIASAQRLLAGIGAALDALAQAEPLAQQADLVRERAELHYLRGNLHFAQGRIAQCRADHALALECARRLADPEWEARAISGLADADYAEGRMRTARERFDECVALCRKHGMTRIAIPNRGMMGNCRLYLMEFEEAVADIQEALALSRQAGSRHGEMFALESMALCLTFCGRHSEAKAPLAASLELARTLGARRYEAVLLCCIAEIELAAGNRSESSRATEQALALSRETGMGFCGPLALALKSRLAGDGDERQRLCREAEQILAAGAIAHNQIHYRRLTIDDAIERGDWTAVAGQADALATYTAAESLPYTELVIARARILVQLALRPDHVELQAERARVAAEFERRDWRIGWPGLSGAPLATLS